MKKAKNLAEFEKQNQELRNEVAVSESSTVSIQFKYSDGSERVFSEYYWW
jgi:hypothetical protein